MVVKPRLAKWFAYAALGPITGPLAAGVVRNLRGGAPILAGLYIVAIVEIPIALAATEAHLLAMLAR